MGKVLVEAMVRDLTRNCGWEHPSSFVALAAVLAEAHALSCRLSEG